jgi:hypothetical protein
METLQASSVVVRAGWNGSPQTEFRIQMPPKSQRQFKLKSPFKLTAMAPGGSLSMSLPIDCRQRLETIVHLRRTLSRYLVVANRQLIVFPKSYPTFGQQSGQSLLTTTQQNLLVKIFCQYSLARSCLNLSDEIPQPCWQITGVFQFYPHSQATLDPQIASSIKEGRSWFS